MGSTLYVETDEPETVRVFNRLGQLVCGRMGVFQLQLPNLPAGLYLVKVGDQVAKKVVVY